MGKEQSSRTGGRRGDWLSVSALVLVVIGILAASLDHDQPTIFVIRSPSALDGDSSVGDVLRQAVGKGRSLGGRAVLVDLIGDQSLPLAPTTTLEGSAGGSPLPPPFESIAAGTDPPVILMATPGGLMERADLAQALDAAEIEASSVSKVTQVASRRAAVRAGSPVFEDAAAIETAELRDVPDGFRQAPERASRRRGVALTFTLTCLILAAVAWLVWHFGRTGALASAAGLTLGTLVFAPSLPATAFGCILLAAVVLVVANARPARHGLLRHAPVDDQPRWLEQSRQEPPQQKLRHYTEIPESVAPVPPRSTSSVLTRPPAPSIVRADDLLVIGRPSKISAAVGLAPPQLTVVTTHDDERWAVRGASAAGALHLLESDPLQDFHVVRVLPDRHAIVAAVCDGTSTGRCSELGAHLAASFAVEQFAAEFDNLVTGTLDVAATFESIARQIVARPSTFGGKTCDDIDLATTLIVAVGTTDPEGGHLLTCARVGDSAAFFLTQDSGWTSLFEDADQPAALHSSITATMPRDWSSAEVVVLPWPRDLTLVLASDGVAVPLTAHQSAVRDELGALWREPPTAEQFGRQVQFSRQGFDDDRTVVAVWPRDTPGKAVPER